jgi:PAS domain S-box-containing protein
MEGDVERASAPSPRDSTGRLARLRSFLEDHRQEYERQVRPFLVARVLVVLTVVVILLVYEEGNPRRFSSAYGVLVAALGLCAAQLAWLRWAQDLERLVVQAVVLDVALAAALTYLTGGIFNIGFVFLFFASILSAVVLISDGAGYLVASFATVSLLAVAFLYYSAANGSIDPPLLEASFYQEVVQRMRPGRVTANLIGMGLAFLGVAFMGSRLPRRLSQAQVVYDEILERLGEGVVAIDRRGRLLIANAEARRLLNWTRAGTLVGRRYEHVLRRRADRQVLDLLARGANSTVELELELRDKAPLPVEVKTTVLQDLSGPGRVRGVVGIFRDLSLRKRMEEAETRVARLLDVEQMALGIAHEIRNPLGSIRGAVQELADRTLTDEGDRKLAGIVRRESDRLDRILQQFLDFARMRPPIRRTLDVRTLVEETATLLGKRDEGHGVKIQVVPGAGFQVVGDPDQLRQAFLNVGVNALEAMAGEGNLQFSLRPASLAALGKEGDLRRLGSRPAVEVAIANDGPALGEEEARQLFTPFYTTKKGGLGLGMSITQKIVRTHEGDVHCDRGPLGGVCFHILLPLEGSGAPGEGQG